MRFDCGHALIDVTCLECWKRKVEHAETRLAEANERIEKLEAVFKAADKCYPSCDSDCEGEHLASCAACALALALAAAKED